LGVLALFAGLWEVSSRSGWVNPELLPPLSVVLLILWKLLRDPAFLGDLRVTTAETIVAYLIVAPTGLLLGFFIGERRWLYRATNPILQLLMATPKMIFLPIFILAFGIGFLEKVMFASMVGIFATVIAGIAAVQSVPQGLMRVATAFGATRLQIYTRIYFPAMIPIIIGGMRLGLIFTIFGVLLSEMYAASRGVGQTLFSWGEQTRLAELLAGVLLVVAITVTLDELMRFGERRSRRRRVEA